MKPEKSNSSYGNWIVRISNTEFKFFWKKAEAEKYIEEFEKE